MESITQTEVPTLHISPDFTTKLSSLSNERGRLRPIAVHRCGTISPVLWGFWSIEPLGGKARRLQIRLLDIKHLHLMK